MPTFAFYRSLYGEDFIVESINSVLPYVDRVYMLLANQTWGGAVKCTYGGREIFYPEAFDRLPQIMRDMEGRSSKIKVIPAYNPLNKNMAQWALGVISSIERPTRLLFMEPDMVWNTEQLERFFKIYNEGSMRTLTAGQIELWRKPNWRVPYRAGRASSFLWDIEAPDRSGDIETTDAMVHNLGFCVSDRAMFWKHMIGLGISGPLRDSMPNEMWFERTWLNWHPITNNRNLEIALGAESNLSHAEPCSLPLPHLLAEGIAKGKWPWLVDRIG